GGPHAKNTHDLKSFKIIKEQSAGSETRRIYATISG
ncbi:alanine-tRNA synthetase second additional domain-containing protein, partial [Candidatus Curtissbacteria bacterium]|nr:alanine-tRNA synthetase second additional domain-containing protein [Candidatus Curtissbacteria bacterium]